MFRYSAASVPVAVSANYTRAAAEELAAALSSTRSGVGVTGGGVGGISGVDSGVGGGVCVLGEAPRGVGDGVDMSLWLLNTTVGLYKLISDSFQAPVSTFLSSKENKVKKTGFIIF